MVLVEFDGATFDRLLTTMDERPEQVGFMLAEDAGGGLFRIVDLRLVAGHRFTLQSEDRADLDDAIRSEMIQWAWREGGCLVEAHSHGEVLVPARFSRFDFSQFDDWVSHVRWRLRQRPYLALVTAGVQVDGLAWLDEVPVAIDAVRVDGREPILTTRESIRYLEERRGR